MPIKFYTLFCVHAWQAQFIMIKMCLPSSSDLHVCVTNPVSYNEPRQLQ